MTRQTSTKTDWFIEPKVLTVDDGIRRKDVFIASILSLNIEWNSHFFTETKISLDSTRNSCPTLRWIFRESTRDDIICSPCNIPVSANLSWSNLLRVVWPSDRLSRLNAALSLKANRCNTQDYLTEPNPIPDHRRNREVIRWLDSSRNPRGSPCPGVARK